MQIEDLVDIYFAELKENPDFIKLLSLKKEIDTKYHKEIMIFKTNESMYLDAKEKGYLTPKMKEDFIKSKTNLYEKEEVKEYFRLERKIDEILNEDFNDIKKSISNKFALNEYIKI